MKHTDTKVKTRLELSGREIRLVFVSVDEYAAMQLFDCAKAELSKGYLKVEISGAFEAVEK